MKIIIIIVIAVAVIFISLLIYGIISEKSEEKARQENLKKFNASQRRLCVNENCVVCGRKLQNTYGYFVNMNAFYTSPVYQKYCWAAYKRIPASDERNEFHTSFSNWREMQTMVFGLSSYNTVVICENCYNRT